ncbi:MAG: PEP-CTERM sorting domain-containing protein [Bryobacteraceae bacterium]
MLKHITPTIIFSIALAVGLAAPMKADIIATIGEYNGAPSFDFDPADYPLGSVLIGDFTFSIPTGESVIGGTISGTFGNDDVSPITAPSDYYIDNGTIEVASCDDGATYTATCDSSPTPTSWSYTLTSSDLSNLSAELASGSIDFTVVQNDAIAVQTGTTTLDLVLTPEPSMIFFLCGGLAGIALLRRFRKA